MNLSDFNRIEKLAIRDSRRLSKGLPNVEEISPKEVYLLDENNRRVRRICGYKEDNWICLYNAGQGTLHEGIGRCKRHEAALTGKKEYLERYLSTLSKESDLTEFFKKADEAEEDFFNIETLVRMVSAVLNHFLTASQFNWSKKDVDRFLNIIDQYRKLIDTQQRKEANKIVASALSTWIRGVLSIIFNNVSIDTYNKIISQISNLELPNEIESIEFEEI